MQKQADDTYHVTAKAELLCKNVPSWLVDRGRVLFDQQHKLAG